MSGCSSWLYTTVTHITTATTASWSCDLPVSTFISKSCSTRIFVHQSRRSIMTSTSISSVSISTLTWLYSRVPYSPIKLAYLISAQYDYIYFLVQGVIACSTDNRGRNAIFKPFNFLREMKLSWCKTCSDIKNAISQKMSAFNVS